MKTALVAAACLLTALIVSSSAQAATCAGEGTHSQRFANWGDDGDYFLAPGGDFESSSAGWTLQRGATVGDAALGAALSLPPGASATSPAICVAPGYTHGRMFGAATGPWRLLGSIVKVDVLDVESGSRPSKLALLRFDRSWGPSDRFLLGDLDFDLDPDTGLGEVRLRFTAIGPAQTLLDDVYIDPSARN
jgi:hypothetical protein